MSENHLRKHPQTSDAPPPDAIAERHWQDLTHTANAAWHGGQKPVANTHYQNALTEAERLLTAAERGFGPTQAAAILVISHHNLAELAQEAGQPDLAMHHFKTAFERLLGLACLSTTPNSLRQSCVANLKEATIALATHMQASGAPIAKITGLIRRAQFVASAAAPTRLS